jgi:ribosome biogenesis GTPase
MRQFGIDSVDRKNLSWYFPEFNPIREGCRYSDCTHEHEPSCAVREAARNGAIAPARYETYLRILDTLR